MPGEEWLDAGAFRVHLDCWRRPEAPATLVVVHGGGGNGPELARAIAADPLAGGTWMPGRFLRTFLESEPLVSPESFDVCPVLLAHPADDRWTHVSLSRPFFERLRVPKRLVLLENAGHFPVEEPGVSQLRQALLEILTERGAAVGPTPAS